MVKIVYTKYKVELMQETLTKIQVSLARIEENGERNTQDLTEHKEGVQQCQVRLDSLEDSRHQLVGIGKFMKWTSLLAGLIWMGSKFLPYIIK